MAEQDKPLQGDIPHPSARHRATLLIEKADIHLGADDSAKLSHANGVEILNMLRDVVAEANKIEKRFGQKQLIRHRPEEGHWGDCTRTAFAIMFGLEPEDVPNFGDFGTDEPNDLEFNRRVNAWLEQRGYAPINCPFSCTLEELMEMQKACNHGVYWVLGGRSRNDSNHSVLCRGGSIISDPSQNDAGIIGPCDDGFFWVTYVVPVDYASPPAIAELTIAITEEIQKMGTLVMPKSASLAELEAHNAGMEAAAKIAASFVGKDRSCEALGFACDETGARECALETRGGTCLCDERGEEAADIAKAIRARMLVGFPIAEPDEGHPHLIHGEFQSDKYPTTPRGFFPMKISDKLAQDLLWIYAGRHQSIDLQLSSDLLTALMSKGFDLEKAGAELTEILGLLNLSRFGCSACGRSYEFIAAKMQQRTDG